MTLTREALCAAARRHFAGITEAGFGVSPEVCMVLGAAELAGAPLDVFDFDDAAVVLRGEALMLEGLAASEALVVARRERAAWAERVGGRQ